MQTCPTCGDQMDDNRHGECPACCARADHVEIRELAARCYPNGWIHVSDDGNGNITITGASGR